MPAQAGHQAGRLWGVAGLPAGPGRSTGRLPCVPRVKICCRPPGRPRPGTLQLPNGHIFGLLFKGFLPQINPNPFANLLSYFLPSIALLTLSSLAFSQSPQ